MDDLLDSNNSRQVWQALQHLNNFRSGLGAAETDASMAVQLNLFFARFKVESQDTAMLHPMAHWNFNFNLCGGPRDEVHAEGH